MAKFLGKQVTFGVSIERSRGVSSSSPYMGVLHNSLDIQDKVEKIVNESTAGNLVEGVGETISKKWSEGNIEFKVGDNSFGYFLLALLGSTRSVNNRDGTYTHTFSLNKTSQHQTLTLFRGDPVQDYKYTNAMLDNLNLNVEVASYLMADASFLAKKGVEASHTTTYTHENTFLPKNIKVIFSPSTASLNSSNAIKVQKVSLNFSKNVVDEMTLGSDEPADFYNTIISVEGSFEVYYDSKTYHNDMVNNTSKALRIEAESSNTIGTGTRKSKLTIELNLVKLQSSPIQFDNSNLVKQTIDFKGYYNVRESSLTSIKLINTKQNYIL